MNAVEYLKKMPSRRGLYDWIRFGFVGLVVFGVFSIHSAFFSNGPHVNTRGFFCALGSALVAMLVSEIILGALDKRFVTNHPEMANLDEWIAVMGSAENYPVDMPSTATMQEAVMKMAAMAQYTNASFAIRDAVKSLLYKTILSEDSGAVLIQKTYEELAARAEATNELYLKVWDLLVRKTAVLPVDFYKDARKFRESLLKRS